MWRPSRSASDLAVTRSVGEPEVGRCERPPRPPVLGVVAERGRLIPADGHLPRGQTQDPQESEESDPDNGLISTVSPIGQALMGKEEGDEVKVKTPSGWRNFEISRLRTIHEQEQ